MHRRTTIRKSSFVTYSRAALGALVKFQRIVVVVGVFLFALAMTTLAVDGTPNRTVNLEFTHSTDDVVNH